MAQDERGWVRNADGQVVRMPMAEPSAPRLRLEPVEMLPGLVVRRILPDEVETFRDVVRTFGGVYAEAHDRSVDHWCFSNYCLPIVVTWRGRILQYETYAAWSQRIDAQLMVRLDRERPGWFWREVHAPVWDALLRNGFTTMEARANPARAQTQQARWGATEWGRADGGQTVVLHFDIASSRQRCLGWPARSTAGVGWSWSYEGLTIREMREEDLPLVAQTIPALFQGSNRSEVAAAMLDPWWYLDRASILLGYEDGALRHIRALRFRESGLASTGALSRLRPTRSDRAFMYGVAEWLRVVGYSAMTSFSPEANFNALMTDRAERGWSVLRRHDQYQEPFYELHFDVAAFLSQPVTARFGGL